MSYSTCGVGASADVAYLTDEEMGVDPLVGAENEVTFTLVDHGNGQYVAIDGTYEQVLNLLDRSRAAVLDRMRQEASAAASAVPAAQPGETTTGRRRNLRVDIGHNVRHWTVFDVEGVTDEEYEVLTREDDAATALLRRLEEEGRATIRTWSHDAEPDIFDADSYAAVVAVVVEGDSAPDVVDDMVCVECGQTVIVDASGVANHVTSTLDIDYDADARHTAVPEIGTAAGSPTVVA